MMDQKERDKIYVFGRLEKLASDQDYYMTDKRKIRNFIIMNNSLLGELSDVHDLTKKEIKTVKKTMNWMEKLGKMLK